MKTIRELRREQGMTLAELGEQIGVRPQAIWHWERGIRTPNVRRLRQLAILFGVPMESIHLPKLNGAAPAGPEPSTGPGPP